MFPQLCLAESHGRLMEWKRAKSFAEEAAKRSQTLASSVSISDLVSETTKKLKDLAAEASKKADQIKTGGKGGCFVEGGKGACGWR